ncbi:MAG: ferritin-like domain-containing protein [Acidimicrobiia bacterium]|nr:ferritin-like domain-containing protein [Acidimicrobiia bacterium]
MSRTGLRSLAGEALVTSDLDERLERTERLAQRVGTGEVHIEAHLEPVAPEAVGRVDRPVLVAPRQVPRRRLGTLAGRQAAVHAVAHIEANAVALALDAVHRFDGLPDDYYHQWADVAAEEALHFRLLRNELRRLGLDYGDLPAHDGLWGVATRTADDPLRRMALVPRVSEARGLDVTPAMIERFDAAGEPSVARVLERILADEVGHVAVADRWFRWLCAGRGLDPEATFRRLCTQAGVVVVPPFNHAARQRAGFTSGELADLEAEPLGRPG